MQRNYWHTPYGVRLDHVAGHLEDPGSDVLYSEYLSETAPAKSILQDGAAQPSPVDEPMIIVLVAPSHCELVSLLRAALGFESPTEAAVDLGFPHFATKKYGFVNASN